MMKEFYQPYFKAVNQILNGNPIKELESIRVQCNESVLNQKRSYTPEAVVITFVADAENKILMGVDPIEAYSGFDKLEPVKFRQTGRTILENAVNHYLK